MSELNQLSIFCHLSHLNFLASKPVYYHQKRSGYGTYLLLLGRLFRTKSEAVTTGVPKKKVFLKISLYSQENTYARVSF